MKKNAIFLILSTIFCTFMFFSCEDMHEKTKEYWGEIVYPAKFDTVIGFIGFERVEINLLKAGRLPASKIIMGKAKKTIVEYEDKKIVIDTLASWVSITGLNQSKIYRFFIYTIDEYNNKSVPQEIALIPFTKTDMDNLLITAPRVTLSPSSAILEWPSGVSSILYNYYAYSYEYKNREGVTVKGDRGSDTRLYLGPLPTAQPTTVKMKYKIIPKYNNVPILDTLYVDREIAVTTPTLDGTFAPLERAFLIANGLNTFTFRAAAEITKLTYPIMMNTFADVFYFANLKELDLTGGNIFEVDKYTYDNRGYQSTIGGGLHPPFLKRIRNNIADLIYLKDLLESGSLTKVKYYKNSMGLDAFLEPYVSKGIVEFANPPNDALIPPNYGVDGLVQDGNWRMDYLFNPPDVPPAEGLQNVYRMIPKMKSATYVWAVPPVYQFNAAEYKYLKYKLYVPAKSNFVGSRANFQSIWLRFMNNMWAFGQNSISGTGQQYWDFGNPTHAFTDANYENWVDYSWDISRIYSQNLYTRVIVFCIGGEKGVDPDGDLVFYVSNVRFSKTP